MANEPTEPRALSAALAAPQPFVTRFGSGALHAANRHVDRWAPETAGNNRPMRSLGFVDRLVAPWIETAQRSASMRLFNQYQMAGAPLREGASVSWVFPRPWYQDELDWMAAARQVRVQAAEGPAPTMLTTRGTFVAPQQQVRPAIAAPAPAMPTALYEYVAPSLSIAQPVPQQSIAGIGYGGETARHDAYSPLIPLAAVQAAALMSSAVAPLVRAPASTDGGVATPSTVGRVSPALRQVLTTMLERATVARTDARIAQSAPELVTPPAPRPEVDDVPASSQAVTSQAAVLAAHYAEQRAQIAEVERVARSIAEREVAVRVAAHATQAQVEATVAATTTAQRVEAARVAATQQAEAAKTAVERTVASQAVAQAVADAERARVEERIAQRIAERTAQTRLHEQSRTEAAEHARGSLPPVAETAPAPIVEAAPPPEVIAAIAALSPELQQMLAARPETGLGAITELGNALRTAEILVRGTESGLPFQVTRGPQLVMPAGLGGLVSAVERAQGIAPTAMFAPSLSAPQAAIPSITAAATQDRMAQQRQSAATRMPTLAWLNGPTPDRAAVGASMAPPTTALAATAAASPAALGHVAWSDRWLARFAGASPRSLEILHAGAAASPEQRMQALAAAAPESVFVRPIFDIETAPRPAARIEAAPSFTQAPTVVGPTLRPQPQMLPVERFDDSAETPDAVFAQIAAAAAGVRATAVTGASAPAPAPAPVAAPVVDYARTTPADVIAHTAPTAPSAGLSAQLAASPFAQALRHVISLPSVASFDVRALFGGGVSTTYLAGLLAASAQELPVASSIASPAWASFTTAGVQAAERAERAAPELDLTYVTPERPETAAAATSPVATSSVATSPVATSPAATSPVPVASYAAPLTTLRTALLSWQLDPAAPTAAQPTIATTQSTPITTATMLAMSETMRSPILGGAMPVIEPGASWTAPGMMAERAHGWSVAQERSASDLSLDFVSPELVLAARVYGLGPAEAAQAARLAIAGPGQLGAMASTVDRTFVQAMAIASDRREAARMSGSIATAYPVATPTSAAPVSAAPVSATTAALGVSPSAGPAAPAPAMAAPGFAPDAMPSTAFGVDRRSPRGAFLWPAASVSALGMTAALGDGPQAMSVAALELLAAQAVAEIGTYAALSDQSYFDGARGQVAQAAEAAPLPGAPRAMPMTPFVSGPSTASSPSTGATSFAEPAEAEVLGAAAALVPMARRARFDALYVALSQSPSGRAWSPAARAARALALAGRGEDAPVSAYDRAASAWDVLPVVYATEGMSVAEIEAASATGTLSQVARASLARTRGANAPELTALTGVESRPGLSGLSARAGEALGSYVAPSTGELATAAARAESSRPAVSASREVPVAQRAPSAAQELVRTGRPAGRHGGGEVEIPAWFETAARKMLDARSTSSSSDGGFSMAELTLVTAAPPAAIAASSKSGGAAASATRAPSPAGAGDKTPGQAIDIEKIALEVYQQILVLMDAARSRNGEPYL